MHLCTITQIDCEREGEQIDRALLKSVLGIFVEIGMGNMDVYETDFEGFMLQDTAAYYSHKVASWIEEDSCPDYMLKVNILSYSLWEASSKLLLWSDSMLMQLLMNASVGWVFVGWGMFEKGEGKGWPLSACK